MTDFTQAANRPALNGYDFQSHFYHRPDGLALHYLDEGRGAPVIMVHGNPSWSFLWRKVIAALAPDFRCLAPDHLGLGWSSRPTEEQYGFRLADRVQDLAALVEHWGLDRPAHLLVHDWGGPIGLTWAAAHPELVASLTILNTGTRVPDGYRLPLRLAAFKTFAPLGAFLAHRFNLFAWGTAVFGVAGELSPEAERGFLAPYLKAEDRLALAKFVEDIPLSRLHPSFDLLAETDRRLSGALADKPLTLVWGLRDFVFTRSVFLDWRQRFPEAPFLALPEAGHYLLEDEPARITAHIRNFITSVEDRATINLAKSSLRVPVLERPASAQTVFGGVKPQWGPDGLK